MLTENEVMKELMGIINNPDTNPNEISLTDIAAIGRKWQRVTGAQVKQLRYILESISVRQYVDWLVANGADDPVKVINRPSGKHTVGTRGLANIVAMQYCTVYLHYMASGGLSAENELTVAKAAVLVRLRKRIIKMGYKHPEIEETIQESADNIIAYIQKRAVEKQQNKWEDANEEQINKVRSVEDAVLRAYSENEPKSFGQMRSVVLDALRTVFPRN
jgi:hypothetical protein